MKILLWSELFWPHLGGIETFARILAEGLQERGFQFSIITSTLKDSPERETLNGIEVFRLPLRTGFSGDFFSIKKVLKKVSQIKTEFKPDLTHLNTAGPSFFYHLQTLNTQPHPTLFTFHFYPPTSTQKDGALQKMFQHTDYFNAVSQDTLNEFIKYSPDIQDRSSVIFNALPFPDFDLQDLPKTPPRIFTFGRQVPEKGFDLALRAFAKNLSRFPNIQLILAGKGPDRDQLEDITQQLGIGSNVNFLGPVSDERIAQEINQSTMILVPSRHKECFGLVALQGMQMGRPVVAARSGGMVEVVSHGETGLVVDQDNVPALAQAMEHLLTNPGLAQKMGQAGRERAIKLFSLEKMLDSYENLYQKLAAG